MKPFNEISWQVTEPEYREDPALSYSNLSHYEKGGKFAALPTLFDKIETPSLTFGSMVDTLITGSEEEFREQFIMIDDFGLSDTLKEIAGLLYSRYKEERTRFDDIPNLVIADVGKECNYYAGDRYAETRVKKIRENCKPYYNMLALAEGKKIVTPQEVEDARRCVNALKTCERTAFYFADNDPFVADIQRFYQLKFKQTLEGIDLRCMADLIVVNHKAMTVQPCDLKTSSTNEWEFPKAFQQWRYDIQARLYWRLIRKTMDLDDEYKYYKLMPFKFIVVNKANCKPMVWDFPLTETLGEIHIDTPSGYKISWRDPYVIAKELKRYLDEKPEIPLDDTTDIVNWLKLN